MATNPTNFKPAFIRENHSSRRSVVSSSLRSPISSRKITNSKAPFGYSLQHWRSSTNTAANKLAEPIIRPNVFHGRTKLKAIAKVKVEPELVVKADPQVDALLNKLQSQNYFQAMDCNAQIKLLIWFDNLVRQEDDLNRTIHLGVSKDAPLSPVSITPFEWFDLLSGDFIHDSKESKAKALSFLDESKESLPANDLKYKRGALFETRFAMMAKILEVQGYIERADFFNESDWEDRAGVDAFLHFKHLDSLFALAVQVKSTIPNAELFLKKKIMRNFDKDDLTEYELWNRMCGHQQLPNHEEPKRTEADLVMKRQNMLTLPMNIFRISDLINIFTNVFKNIAIDDNGFTRSAEDTEIQVELPVRLKRLKLQNIKLLNSVLYEGLDINEKKSEFGRLYIKQIHD